MVGVPGTGSYGLDAAVGCQWWKPEERVLVRLSVSSYMPRPFRPPQLLL